MVVHDRRERVIPLRVCVVCAAAPNRHEAVGDASWLLARELSRENQVALVVSSADALDIEQDVPNISVSTVNGDWGIRTLRQVAHRVDQIHPDVVLVHFVPQLYGWNGAKPGLAVLLHMLKRRGCKIVTIAHELNAPFGPSARLMAWSVIHRMLFRVIVAASRKIVLTTELRCTAMKQSFARRRDDCHHIPIGTTIPVVPVARQAARGVIGRQYGIGDNELMVVSFGSTFPSVMPTYRQFFRRWIREGLRFRVMVVGRAGKEFRQLIGDERELLERMCFSGALPSVDISRVLSAGDLYVTFYPDGASTRRSSLLAALAHGIPAISNQGENTDALLKSSGAVLLVDERSLEHGLGAATGLARDTTQRMQLGERGRKLYDDFHAWPRIGQEYLHVMQHAI